MQFQVVDLRLQRAFGISSELLNPLTKLIAGTIDLYRAYRKPYRCVGWFLTQFKKLSKTKIIIFITSNIALLWYSSRIVICYIHFKFEFHLIILIDSIGERTLIQLLQYVKKKLQEAKTYVGYRAPFEIFGQKDFQISSQYKLCLGVFLETLTSFIKEQKHFSQSFYIFLMLNWSHI